MKIVGKGAKGDFFGKLDNVVCFITDNKHIELRPNDLVEVKVVHVVDKCLFGEIINYSGLNDG